jgi:hypothetical protein
LFFAAVLFASRTGLAQPTDPAPPSDDPGATPPTPSSPPPSAPPPDPVLDPPSSTPTTSEPPREEEKKPPMSEGRLLVSLYNSGFQWGISPGVAFANGKAGFLLGLNFGYGFDTGPVILVPGVRLTGYFLDPVVLMGMPTFKVVLPIDRFAPFVEVGAGPGHITKSDTSSAQTGVALMGGGGFMIHFTPGFALGAHASYQVITGTDFKGFAVGPILAIGF